MNKETFKKILKIWKQAEKKKLYSIKLPRTEQCLSFAQFKAGKFNKTQREHINNCDYCTRMNTLFSKHLDSQNEVIKKFDENRRVIDKKFFLKNNKNRIKERFGNILDKLGKIFAPVPAPIRLVVPAMLAIVIFVFLFLPLSMKQTKFADLAIIEPVYYQLVEIRAGQANNEAERIFNEGMIFYQENEHEQAIKKLSQVIQLQPDDVNGHFYLGVCYLLTKKANQAILHFQKVIKLNATFLFEKCYWYLGNAYLLEEDGKQALEMFKKVSEMEGDYEWEAMEMIEKINK